MTNGDMIRSMNNKELAKYLSNMMNCDECYRVQEETMRDIKVYRMNDYDCVASNLNDVFLKALYSLAETLE